MKLVKHQGFNILVLILSGITVAYIVFPLASILTFVEPNKLLDSLTRAEVWDAFVLSLSSASISTLLLALFGIPLAYFLARYTNFRGKFVIRVVVIIPLVLPPLASGALLLGVYGSRSNLVQYSPGVEFTQSMLGVIIAQTYIASPFMILASQAAFESVQTLLQDLGLIRVMLSGMDWILNTSIRRGKRMIIKDIHFDA